MVSSEKFWDEVRRLVRLSLPIFVAQIAQTLMVFIDTVMAGAVSATDLAAVAIAASIWFPVVIAMQGVLMALTPIVAHYFGAGQLEKIPQAVWQAIWVGLALSVVTVGVLQLSPLVIAKMVSEPELARLTQGYLDGIVWGAPAFALYMVLRSFSEGMNYTRASMVIAFIGLALNIPSNYLLIYGKLGLPALGGAGCGWATAVVIWGMFLSLLVYTQRHAYFSKTRFITTPYAPSFGKIKGLLKLGIPISAALFFEVTLFAVVALLLAPLGAITVAAHQVAINFSSLVFMVPLSLGMGITIRVGTLKGAGEVTQAFYTVKVGTLFGLMLAIVTALVTVTFRYQIADIYTDDQMVIDVAATLLLLACVYQLPDTVQVIGSCALRGFKDGKPIFIITLVSYWVVGLPVGYTLAMHNPFGQPLGATGFWIGFISGLSLASVLFSWRLRQLAKRV